jgi:hypothetical protein
LLEKRLLRRLESEDMAWVPFGLLACFSTIYRRRKA